MAVACVAAQAADADGRYAIEGIGVRTCRDFAEVRASGNAETYQRYRNWLEGYLTGVNRFQPDTYDAAPWQSPEVLAIMIYNHCRQNPNTPFFQVAQDLTAALQKDRLRKGSTRVEVSVRGNSVYVYEEVLRRAQAELVKRRLYSGTPDGSFGPRTQQAIERFQKAEGIDTTGLPDQLTLWRLLKP